MISDLEKRLAGLESRRTSWLEDLRVLTESQRAFRPAPEAWSLLQVTEHLVLVEEVFLAMLSKGEGGQPLKKSLRDRLMSLVLALFFRLGLRARIPAKSVDPSGEVSREELERRWGKVRSDLRAYLAPLSAGEAERPVVRHPIAGPMSAMELTVFLGKHIDHHRRQAERIRRGKGFPLQSA